MIYADVYCNIYHFSQCDIKIFSIKNSICFNNPMSLVAQFLFTGLIRNVELLNIYNTTEATVYQIPDSYNTSNSWFQNLDRDSIWYRIR